MLIKHDELWCCDAVLHIMLNYKRVKENFKTKILISLLFSKENVL